MTLPIPLAPSADLYLKLLETLHQAAAVSGSANNLWHHNSCGTERKRLVASVVIAESGPMGIGLDDAT
ncbi:hypothetical protein [Moorena producens]|uniref:hypothetical protein n=1 Tax=Moorena producens TaxID=1155739 RepID=UPI003C74E7AB